MIRFFENKLGLDKIFLAFHTLFNNKTPLVLRMLY